MNLKKITHRGWLGVALILFSIIPFFVPLSAYTGIDAVNVIRVEAINYTQDGGCIFRAITDGGPVIVNSPECGIRVISLTNKMDLRAYDYQRKTWIQDIVSFRYARMDVRPYLDKAIGPQAKIISSSRDWIFPKYCGGPDCVSKQPRCSDGLWSEHVFDVGDTWFCHLGQAADNPASPQVCTSHVISTDSCSSYKNRVFNTRLYIQSMDNFWKVSFPSANIVKCCPTEFDLGITLDKEFAKKQAVYVTPTTTTSIIIIQTTTTSSSSTTTTLASPTTTLSPPEPTTTSTTSTTSSTTTLPSSTSTTTTLAEPIPPIPPKPSMLPYLGWLRLAAFILGVVLLRQEKLIHF